MRAAASSAPIAVILLATLLAPLIATGCAGRQDGVRLVQARIDGLTCDKCVPPLTKSLHNRFASAAVVVDDDKDTATLRWKRGEAFSADDFGQAVADVRMRVLDLNLEACGHAEAHGADRILAAGSSRFVLRGSQTVPLDQPICIAGRLDSRQQPAVLEIAAVTPSGN
jgi:hypothetical protein